MFAFTLLFVYLSIFLSDYDSWSLLEGLMLNLKLQYSGHLMQRTNSLEKTLMLGHEFAKNLKIVKDRRARCAAVQGVTNSQTQLRERMTTIMHELTHIEFP